MAHTADYLISQKCPSDISITQCDQIHRLRFRPKALGCKEPLLPHLTILQQFSRRFQYHLLMKRRRRFISLLILATAICSGNAFTSKALAESERIPVDKTVLIYGQLKSMHECRTGKLGTKVLLQANVNGNWKTVASSQQRKIPALCPTQVAKFNWMVDVLGQSAGVECGVNKFLVQLRTFSPTTKSVGTLWIMQQYSSKSDH